MEEDSNIKCSCQSLLYCKKIW